MPLKATLGAIAEFTQGYIAPYPLVDANAIPANLGLGANIIVTPNTTINIGTPITYYANSNTGNYKGNTTSANSTDVTTIGVFNMEPFNTYYFDVYGSAAGGNTNTIQTNNVTIGCNVIANGNIAVSGTPQCMAFNNSGNTLHLISGNIWHRYSRNETTGVLTLSGNTTPPNRSTLNSIATFSSNNQNYVMISGSINRSNPPYGTFPVSVIWLYNDTTLISTTYAANYSITPNWLMSTSQGDLLLLTRRSPTPSLTPYQLVCDQYSIGTNTLSYVSTVNIETVTGVNNYSIPSQFITTTTNDGNSAYILLQTLGNGTKDIIGLETVGTMSYVGSYNVSNGLLTVYTGIYSSADSKSVYGIRGNTINQFSRNTVDSTLTFVGNISGSNVGNAASTVKSVVFTGANQLYDRNITTGNLTLNGNSNSYTYGANTTYQTLMSPDSKNIYILNSNNIGIFNIVS